MLQVFLMEGKKNETPGTKKNMLIQPKKQSSRLSVTGYVETWCREVFMHNPRSRREGPDQNQFLTSVTMASTSF
ncbi:MAG: hypothetical protein CVV48_09140 [Spirochaetae bacterium HGW-Spirochaetae-4]|nr:MAG: hypothetical protein CVV48_09140 [Spirochaetae bacterium HGW-Spirochaetae-4]